MARKNDDPEITKESEILEALRDDKFCDEIAYQRSEKVVKSPVMEASGAALGMALHGSLYGDAPSAKQPATMIKHFDDARFNEMKDAMKTSEAAPGGTASYYTHDGTEIRMPSEVSAKPNRLYHVMNDKKQWFKQRKQADALLNAIFLDEAPKIYECCTRMGFEDNPLVAVSQMLYHYLTNDIPLDYREYAVKIGDDNYNDDDIQQGSPWIQGLNKCFYGKTVKDICLKARYEKIGILSVIRAIMNDVCKTRLVSEDFGKKKEAVAA